MTPSRRPGVKDQARAVLPAVPVALWLGIFLLAPMAVVVLYSFFSRGPYGSVEYTLTLENYRRLADPLYLSIYGRSIQLAALTTLACLVLGFPVAMVIATARRTLRNLLFVLLMVPFLTNFVVRVYAVRVFLGVEGPLNSLLQGLGVVEAPLLMTDSDFAVAIGMIINYLPFMVLPIVVVLDRFDWSLIDAAQDLGAHGGRLLLRVLLPLARPGIVSGSLLVFIPVLGEFMIPDLLGGARTMLLGNLITEQFLKVRDWPFGSALAVTLIVLMGLGIVLQRLWGSHDAGARS